MRQSHDYLDQTQGSVGTAEGVVDSEVPQSQMRVDTDPTTFSRLTSVEIWLQDRSLALRTAGVLSVLPRSMTLQMPQIVVQN